jgi:hypothetical protein
MGKQKHWLWGGYGMSTWRTLSDINVNENKKDKGGFDYLSWTWAIAAVKRAGMNLNWEILPDVHYPSGTMEVRMNVIINGESHVMWLAVTNHRNQAIKHPEADAINKARMRCLVKGIAVHGLGFYIYAGEDLPLSSPHELFDDMQGRIAADKYEAGIWYMSQSEEVKMDVYNSAPKGEVSNLKRAIKEVTGIANTKLFEIAEAIQSGVEARDAHKVLENADGLSQFEKSMVWDRLPTNIQDQAIEIIKESKS